MGETPDQLLKLGAWIALTILKMVSAQHGCNYLKLFGRHSKPQPISAKSLGPLSLWTFGKPSHSASFLITFLNRQLMILRMNRVGIGVVSFACRISRCSSHV